MNSYTIALFVHIVGALGFFMALGAEWLSVRRMRRAASAEQAREWLDTVSGARRAGMASMLAILVAGFFMMAVGQLSGAWMIVAFWTMVVLAALAVGLSGRRMAAIRRAVRAESPPTPAELRQLLDHPQLWLAIQLRLALAFGIVFLMAVKPALAGSLLAIAVAAVIGAVAGLPGLARLRAPEEIAR